MCKQEIINRVFINNVVLSISEYNSNYYLLTVRVRQTPFKRYDQKKKGMIKLLREQRKKY